MKLRFASLLLLTAVSAFAQAGPPPPLANAQLKDPVQEARATALMDNLRCVECQGQSIHDSDAPIAAAMRHEVRSRVASGQSNGEIEQWLVTRYGDWISFAPPLRGAALLLWLLPLLLFVFALWLARGRFRRSTS